MATKQITQYIDDFDGSELGTERRTVRFALEGRSYEIDLSPENASKLEDALAPFIQAGRVTTSAGKTTVRAKRSSGNSLDLGGVRAWARANGHAVSDRGRVSTMVLEAYQAAN